MKSKFFKLLAKSMLLTLTYQLVFPAFAYALTTGPSQPEVQSFEPVGTTEMVDMFTGDFNYNIPLMDVEGYPINIFYHSGVGIEQEASWVGLGWNINPGEINRTVRGLPDDFKGEEIKKSLYIKPEVEYRAGMGANVALEVFGKDLSSLGIKLDLGANLYMAHNNYRGLSSGISYSTGLSTPVGSVGIGLGVGTQTGADKDIYASLNTPDIMSKASLGVSVNGGVGYNSRSGLKATSFGVGVSAHYSGSNKNKTIGVNNARTGLSANTTIPIGVQNYVPVIANRMKQSNKQLQFKLGFSFGGTTGSAYVQGNRSEISYDEDGSLNAYGYLYLDDATKIDMLDFSREKDGVYNATVKNLPAAALTYDVYSVNGHGTGGMFRPFRNDIGTIYDPYIYLKDPSQRSDTREAGVPGSDYGEIGDDITWMNTVNESGPWPGIGLDFSKNTKGSLFENVFFKQAGELTYNQQQEASSIFNNTTQYLNEGLSTLIGKGNISTGSLPNVYKEGGADGGRILWNNAIIDRSSRAANISYQTAEQAMKVPDMDLSKKIVSYNDATHFYEPTLQTFNRFGTTSADHKDKAHHISEFTQTMPDGRRYVYGIPALNNITNEVTFAAVDDAADLDKGYVPVDGHDKRENGIGRDNFYSSTITPTHAHSYLLTALLSADYVDILGDGPTDDDLGTYVKYNYTLKSDDYRWRTPYESNQAQLNPGFWSDNSDAKGNYIVGSRQQWMVRTIETKNYVAEFYTSPRTDAKGITAPVTDPLTTSGPYSGVAGTGKNISYKLDQIKLYNKHDRYINKDNATPIKTVIFNYSYNQCKGLPNSSGLGGKLTLEKIFIKYGNSQKNLLSPYVFEYNVNNPNYNFAAKDRWGNYKKVVAGIHNYEFPYTNQPDNLTEEAMQNADLSAWNLTDIKLPSGGKIHVDFESDDYAYVQNKRSMQMLHIEGVGSTESMIPQSQLYTGEEDINDYVYFKRRADRETFSSPASFKDNYLEGQDLLYYSFALDIAAVGKYEPIKGFAKIDKVGICPDNSSYGYIKLKREPANDLNLHPATILGINTGRYYIPHIFYDGYSASNPFENFANLIKKFPELFRAIGGQNPFKHFVKKGKAKNLQIANSFIRLQTPALSKKGGGIRVKQLTLSDNWNKLSGNQDASYGKKYDYTINDPRYGKISSGVASYEPMIGADENPLRQPVPYSAESGKGIPSVDFYQEEPFGESFFPPASVGYSSVKVSSIHQEYGRSAQAIDEYLFYTAKDYPVKVDYTEKDPSGARSESTFKKQYDEAKVRQGYCIKLNDMHGKPKAVNNYVVHKDVGNIKNELITGTKYYYNEDAASQLNNNVRALIRKRGTQNTFEVKDVLLGQDMDFTVDTRYRSSESSGATMSFNCNVLQIWGVPVPVPTLYNPSKKQTTKFHSLVSTKIVQQYGILRAIESIDHGAKTTTENLVYDAETGTPLLTRTNNEFNEYTCNLTHPAYLAYEGMRPAYTNDGYEEVMDSLVVGYDRNGYLYTDNFDRFSDGDELLVQSKGRIFKLWVEGTGVDLSVGTPVDSGQVVFAKFKSQPECTTIKENVIVNVYNTATPAEKVGSAMLKNDIIGTSVDCGSPNAFTLKLPIGTYTYTTDIIGHVPVPFTITKNDCEPIIFNSTSCPGYGHITFKKEYVDLEPDHRYSHFKLYLPAGSESVEGNLVNDNSHYMEFCNIPEGFYILNYDDGRTKPEGGYNVTIEIKKDQTTRIEIEQKLSKPWPLKPNLTQAHISTVPDCPTSDYSGGGTSGSGDAGRGLSKMTSVSTSEGTVLKRCALKVSPRYKNKFAGTTNVSTWPTEKTKYPYVLVKVIRSGRRNNLNQTVQQTNFAAVKANFDAEHTSTLDLLFQKTTNILSSSVNTFTENAQMYASFTDEMDISGDHKYALFNPYVLGRRGNFRPLASYAPIANRSYSAHTRQDGAYSVPTTNQFWSINNGRMVSETECDGPTDLFAEQTRTGTQFWKMASKITRYDIFGNALEEQDAIGNYSSAQYGYNKALPVSVASNAKHQQFMFDGFEDYNMLLTQKLSALFLKGDLYSAFALLYSNPKAGTSFSAYGQNYHLRDMAPSGAALVLTQEANHTGFFSMKSNSATTFNFNIGDASTDELGPFKMSSGKKYLLQFWAKSTSGIPITDEMFSTSTSCISEFLKLKTGNIDGWYQLEAVVDLTSSCSPLSSVVALHIPANVYIDDVRLLPTTSNMKSFVYDPISFKLIAQLDENHMATFFEYDQEGLLVRTKKETAKGIVTISESRRANSKKPATTPTGTSSTSDGGSPY